MKAVRPFSLLLVAACFAFSAACLAAPRVAVFPLAGDADAELREKVGFSIRSKLARDGTYEAIDGITMSEVAGVAPVLLDAKPSELAKLAAGEKPAVLIWGELSGGTPTSVAGSTLRLKILDLRQANAKHIDVTKKLSDPTDLRFVTEEIIQAVPGVAAPRRPNEDEVIDDEESKSLWANNPNLVSNGDFSDGGAWDAIYEAKKYRIALLKKMPAVDMVGIFTPAAGGDPKPNPLLAMVLSRDAAENAGMACLSDPIRIKPGRRYRISFRYQSDGPTTHVFVKGYTTGPDLKGADTEREVFRTQVSPTGPTRGQWRTVIADINPYHPSFAVEQLRVDLYAYLSPGTILWDDVVVKDVGPLTKKPVDDAIEKPVTRPAGKQN